MAGGGAVTDGMSVEAIAEVLEMVNTTKKPSSSNVHRIELPGWTVEAAEHVCEVVQ